MPTTAKHRSAVDLYNAGQLEAADRVIRDALREDDTGEMWNDWAVIQFALGRTEEAKSGFRRAMKLDPGCADAETNLAAVNAASSVVASDVPFASEAEEALTQAHRKRDGASAELKQAAYELVAKFPKHDEARFFLADILEASGQADMALAEYKTLEKTAPRNLKHRLAQSIQKCRADHDYFPPEFAARLESKEYSTPLLGQAKYASTGDDSPAHAAPGADPDDTGADHTGAESRIDRDRELMAESWRSYADREIQRGREIARIVRKRIPLEGRRVLDVGCGYGVMLISFAEQGADAVGVEIDEDRFKVGKKRLADLGINADYRMQDICAPDALERLGTFDAIVAQDVMEHVMDPFRAIRAMSLLLRRGGVIYVQVGNKYSFDQLQADHHYRLAGITLLARDQAIEYFRLATGFDTSIYGVGYWRTERFYRRMFAKFGVPLEHLDAPATAAHVQWYANMANETCRRAAREIYPGLRPELERSIRRRIGIVARYYFRVHDMMCVGGTDPSAAALCDAAVKRVCTPVWRFIGMKPTAVAPRVADVVAAAGLAAGPAERNAN
jgi:SAM-dependent methyltransferase